MWFHNYLFASLIASGVWAAPEKVFTELDVVEYLQQNPFVLPPRARTLFNAHAQTAASSNRSPLSKRQSSTAVAILGALQNAVESLDKPVPQSQIAAVREAPSPRFPEAMRKKIRYGPYRIPPVSEKNIESQMLNQKGMSNMLKIGAKKPCGRNCRILAINANLEDAKGDKIPNTPEGAWLHHCVLLNVGPSVRDATCGGIAEHVFESGNERSDSPYYSPMSKVKSGYHVRRADVFVINTELMNLEDREKWAWVTLEYDYIEGFDPAWKEGKIVWMSIGPNRCTGSDVNPFGLTNLTKTQQPIRDTFQEYSVPWTAPEDALVLGGNCHLHDGGITTKFFLENKMICESQARYAKGMGEHAQLDGSGSMPGMRTKQSKRQMGIHMNSEIDHIEEQPPCIFNAAVPMKRGQDLYINAAYDFTQHSGMRNKNGELDEVMAIAGALVAFDYPFK